MRTNLDTDPRILELSDILGIPELHVVGCLWKLWSWADEHTTDGNARCVTVSKIMVTLDRYCGVNGFCEALTQVGWLSTKNGELCFPRFDEHNGQTAKQRALTAKRVAIFKEKHKTSEKTPGNAKVTEDALPREEKRRVEKNIEEPLPLKLQTDEFRKAWEDWNRHRKEIKKPLTATQTAKQLAKLEALGVARAVEIINHTIEKGWQGLREPTEDLVKANNVPGQVFKKGLTKEEIL